MAKNEQNENLHKLVEKASLGDENAFAIIYDEYFEKIYRFVYFRVNHSETAEDLVSETFIKAWEKMPGIKNQASFNGWLYQIARNLVIDYYRTNKASVDIKTLENVLEFEQNIVDKANLNINQEHFLKALKNLSDDQQIVIKLKFIEDLDNEEIAELLDKPEGTIRVLQHRAINKLKDIIKDENNGI